MLSRIERNRQGLRHFERKSMLGVMRRTVRVTVPPARIDLIDTGELPVAQATMRTRVDPGLLQEFAPRRIAQRFTDLLTSCHGLPIARIVGSLEQQHAQVRRMDQN